MRVQLEILTPCVQHAKKADLGSKMFIIGGNLKQGRRTAMKQEIVDNLLVVEGQPAQLMGDGEDHMDIFDWQKFCPASIKPSFASVYLAFRAMPRTARIEGGGFLPALSAPIQVSSKGCRSAPFDGDQYADVHPRQPGPILFNEAAPQARIISATSKGGRFIACVASESALAGPSR